VIVERFFFPDESLIQPTFVLPTSLIKQNIEELCPRFLDLCAEYKYEQAAISSKSFSLSEFLSHRHAHNSISPSQIAVQWPCFEGERAESSRGEELRGGRGKEKENETEVEVESVLAGLGRSGTETDRSDVIDN